MTVCVAELNLPAPPALVQQQLLDYLRQVSLDADRKRWLDEFHGKQINSALHLFYPAPEPWQTNIANLYQKYFVKHQITVVFGIMTNAGNQPACLPPHTDRARGLAINYYLELGGSQVETVFYSQTRSTLEDQATNFSYSQAGQQVHRQNFSKQWYAYDVNRAHSVENILTTRFILALVIESPHNQYQLQDFLTDYANLVVADMPNK